MRYRGPRSVIRHEVRALASGLLLSTAFFLFLTRQQVQAVKSPEIPFEKHTVDVGFSESCAVADVNDDGRLDIVSGENWYEQGKRSSSKDGTQWVKHKFRE